MRLNIFKKQDSVPVDASSEPIDPKTLDWDSPSDMDNPHNWSFVKKWSTMITAAMLCLVVTMGSSLYVTGVPKMVEEYHYSQTLAIAGLTFYLVGLSVTIGAPLSEMFGRKPVYVVSLPISMLFAMGVPLSNGHLRIIIPLRFFSGFFASPALSIAAGTIMDIFDIDEVSVACTFFCLAPFLGPVISPVMASFACEMQGWRWGTYIQLIAGGLIMPFLLIMPETHKGIILKNRAKKRGMNLMKPTGEESKLMLKNAVKITLTRPLEMLVVEPIVLVFSIYIAFIFAVLFAFFEAYPVIYRGVYHFNEGISGLPFLGIGIGLWLGSAFYLWLDRRYIFPAAPEGTPNLENPTSLRIRPYRGKRDPTTNKLLPIVPEDLLIAMKFGSIALPIGLFWQAWTSRTNVHWMAPIAAGVPFGFGLILIFFTCIMYFSTCYPPLFVASAMAANNMLRYVASSVFPLFTVQMYTNLGIDWASTLFALVCCVMIPVPWLFERYGSKLRNISRFGWAAHMKNMQSKNNDDVEANTNKEDEEKVSLSSDVTSQTTSIEKEDEIEETTKVLTKEQISENSTESTEDDIERSISLKKAITSNESSTSIEKIKTNAGSVYVDTSDSTSSNNNN